MKQERQVMLQMQVPQSTWLKLRDIKLDNHYRSWKELLEKELLG